MGYYNWAITARLMIAILPTLCQGLPKYPSVLYRGMVLAIRTCSDTSRASREGGFSAEDLAKTFQLRAAKTSTP